jgi:hypothetical protein
MNETKSSETKSSGLRMPVQAAVDRTATYAALQAVGVEASQVFFLKYDVCM